MALFRTRDVVLDCDRCGSQLAYVRYRVVPARLDLLELDGAPMSPQRAGRVLQTLDSGAWTPAPERAVALRTWLNRNAIELVYRMMCPQHGRVWVAVPDITAAIRQAGPGVTVTVPTH